MDTPVHEAKHAFDVAGGREGFRVARRFLDLCSEKGEEYAGLPMPIEGEHLVIHPKYRFAEIFAKPEPEDTAPEDADRYNVINTYEKVGRRKVILQNVKTKRASLLNCNGNDALKMLTHTLGCVDAWEIEAEQMALQKLAHMIDHRKFRSYLLAGQFIERSKRSKVWYIFRRLRPTIALSASIEAATFLCTLCLHPIGYYENSFAGTMVPTDDVVAHLTLMRGDEHEFWKQANQCSDITNPCTGI